VTRLFLLEPEQAGPAWAPFAGVRPLSELRAGAWLIRERWEAALGCSTEAILDAQQTEFADVDSPPVRRPAGVSGPAIVASSICVPPRMALVFPAGIRRLTVGGETVAWSLAAGEGWSGPDREGAAVEIAGLLLRGAFDLVTALERLLGPDCLEFTVAPADPIPDGCIVLGDPSLVVCLDAVVEPGVVFDTRKGAVVLTEGVEVRSGTRLEGPLFAGPGTMLLGGQIRQSAFGPQCRVQGEVSNSVMTGYANKAHDGFLGHSVLGAWVNLGAGTITSNLKNTYGPIRLDLPGGRVETGRTFLGTLFADHAKTAIGTMLGTGTAIGAGANVFGPGEVPKHVPPFAWGSTGGERLAEDGFLRIAARVMARRQITLTPERERSLTALYHRLAR
jgi:UDP-N-acetylglucosamine diphosphorylase/glucosamine-1-phosphate N-acetyltransferase